MQVDEKRFNIEEFHKHMAVSLFNSTWDYLDKEERTDRENETMIHMAHASRYHWEVSGDPINLARGDWQVSRVYAVLGRFEPALHHAQQSLDVCLKEEIKDFDLAFAYEALARAYKVGNQEGESSKYKELAFKACDEIAKEENRKVVIEDLTSI